ncbi:GGDEF domain-containing protein [Rhizobium gallicum]|nr:GGDEF domain-containing protein [Rhizobium gallicum]
MEMQNIIFYLPSSLFLIMAFVFLLLWRIGLSSSWQWGAGFAQTASGFALSSFPIEPTFDQFTSGILYIGAAYSYGSAILIHFEQPLRQWTRRALAIGFLAPHTYLVLIIPSLRWDLFLIEIVFACLLGSTIWLAASRAKFAADVAFIIASSLVVIDCLVRGVVFTFLIQTSDEMADFLHSAYNLSVHVSTITVCMLFPFSAIAAMTAAAVNRHRNAAEQDPLTSLLNRRGFEQATQRSSGGTLLTGAIIVCDIDHFKKINDSFGHATGDHVIVEVSKELLKIQNQKTHIARFGGEEFVIFVLDASEIEVAQIAETLREKIATRRWVDLGFDRKVTASFGVAELDLSDFSVDAAIDRADRALYLAKLAGRNQVALASSIQEKHLGSAGAMKSKTAGPTSRPTAASV